MSDKRDQDSLERAPETDVARITWEHVATWEADDKWFIPPTKRTVTTRLAAAALLGMRVGDVLVITRLTITNAAEDEFDVTVEFEPVTK